MRFIIIIFSLICISTICFSVENRAYLLKNKDQIVENNIQKRDLVNEHEMQQPNTACFTQNKGQIGDAEGQLFSGFNLNQGFEENKGQIFDETGKFRSDVYFVSNFSGANVFFTNEGVVFYFKKIEPSEFDKILSERIPNPYSDKEWEDIMKQITNNEYKGDLIKPKGEFYRIDITFPGATLNTPLGENEMPEKRNYFNPQYPDGLMNVPIFESIRYNNVYQGIDLVFYLQSGKLKYDFEISAGADPSLVKILYKGQEKVSIDEEGNAVVKILPGEIIENSPVSFQNGEIIESEFIVSNDTIMFQLGDYDRSQPITIDPSLTWSTYFYDGATTTAAFSYTNPVWDSNGNMYIVQNTYNKTNFPVINPGGAYTQTGGYTGLQLTIMKFNTSRQIVWSTYYTSSQSAKVKFTNQCAAIDQNNNLYIIGSVFYVYASPAKSFPLQSMGGAYYETEQGNNRNFILKFSSTGARLWATMFNKTSGTSSSGLELCGITIDNNNKLVMTGETYTPPSWNPMPLVNPGGSYYYKSTSTEASVPTLHRFSTTGVLEWSTYICQGNSGAYNGNYTAIDIDASNNIFMGGSGSGSYTTVNPGGAYVNGTACGNGRKIQIFKFASTGALNWCTLYGGTYISGAMLWQDCRDLKVAPNGDVVLVGRANATNFPWYNPGGAYYKNYLSTGSSSVCDGVILQFSNGGVRKWATYCGGNGTSDGTDFWGLGIDASNNIFVSGVSRTTNTFPTQVLAGSYNQSSNASDYAVVLAQFNISGVKQWASYFGNKTWTSCGGFGLNATACGSKIVQCGEADNAYTITTVDPGGGAYFHSAKEAATGRTDFIAEFLDATSGSSAPSSINPSQTSICNGDPVTLTVVGGSLGTGASWEWYSGSCGGTSVGTGTSIVVSPTSTTTYYVRAEGPCGTTTCVSITISIYNSGTSTGTWVGGYSTNWFDCRNWGNGRIPDATINATIPSGCTYYPIITTNTAYCKYMYLNSGGYITVNGGTLNVVGYFYKNSGGYATYTSGTCNVSYRYDNSGPSGNTTVNGGTLNIGTAATSSSYYIRNLNGILNVSSGYLDAGYYLYNYNGYPSNNVNITGGSVYADNIPNYEGAIYQSGGTLTTNGYYREYDSGGGNYYGSGSGTINFNGTSNTYIRLMRAGTYFNHVNINGAYYIETGSLQNLDVNGNFTIASGKSFDCNAYTMYIAGSWINSGTFIHDNNTVHMDGITNSQIKGSTITTFYNLNLNSTSTAYNALENGTGNGAGIRINVQHDLTITDGSFELNTNASGGTELDVNGQINIGANGIFNVNDGSCEITCAGSWTNSGQFDSGSNIVYFDGTGILNSGGTTTTKDFYNLNCTAGTRTISTNHVQIINNFTISGGNWTPTNVYTYVNGNISKTDGILTMNSSLDRIYHSGTSLTITGGTVSLTLACQIHTSGNVAISNDNTFVSSDVRFYMEGTTNTTISMTGANNRIYNYFFNTKTTGIKVTALSDITIYHFIHDNGIFDVNGNSISNYGVYYGYDYGELRMASGLFRVGSNSYNGGSYSPFYCAANWSESISGGTIEVYGGNHATYGNVCFISGSNFTPTGGTFKLTGINSKVIQIREATNFNFYNLVIGNGTNAITGSLWASGETCDINGDNTISTNSTFNSVSMPIEIAGNWTNNSSFIYGTGTVTFDGLANQIINGSSSTTYYNLTLNKPSNDVTLQKNTYVSNNLNLTLGLMHTSVTNILTMNDNSTSTNTSDASFVNGPMIKVGNDAFEFPVGKNTSGNIWAPIAISAPSLTTDAFTMEYFFTDPGHYFWNQAYMTNLHHVTSIEYWEVVRSNGNSTPALTLYWKNALRSCIHSLSDTKVAHWNVSTNKWENMGGNAAGGVSPTTGIGQITSSVTFPNYSPVTFGSLSASNPLPIELVNFEAKCMDNYIELQWTTSSEINNDYFTLERSSNGEIYDPIAYIQGAGFSNNLINYFEYDYNPLGEISYYRLRQTDIDGKETVSLPITINCGINDEEFNVQLIDKGENLYTIVVNGCYNDLNFYVTDQLGRKIYTENIINHSNNIIFSLPECSSAIYNMVVICGDKIVTTKFFNK